MNSRARSSDVTITIWEGRNRELRRIFAKIDLKVSHLKRVAVGPLTLGEVPVGAYRRLQPREVAFALARLKPGWKPRKRRPTSR